MCPCTHRHFFQAVISTNLMESGERERENWHDAESKSCDPIHFHTSRVRGQLHNTTVSIPESEEWREERERVVWRWLP